MQKQTPHTHPSYGHDRRAVAARAAQWDTKLKQDAMFEELVSIKDNDDTFDSRPFYPAREEEMFAEQQAVLDADPLPDVEEVHAAWQAALARAADAHALLPVLRATDAPLAEGVLARHTEQARRRIGEIRVRAHSLAALIRAQLHAVSSTISSRVLPAPRLVAQTRAA